MNDVLITEIRNIIEFLCKEKTNKFGYRAFTHITDVVNFSGELAKKLNADEEIVTIASYMHDYGSIIGEYEDHHIIGAEFAEKLLREHNYLEEKIKKVKYCISTHRGSKDLPRGTIEAKIVSSADAMSHYKDIFGLFYLAWIIHKLPYEEGKKFVKEKLERSWDKIELSEGRKMIRKERAAAMIFLQCELKS